MWSAFEGFYPPEPFAQKNYTIPLLFNDSGPSLNFYIERRYNLSEFDRQDFSLHYKNFKLTASHFGRTPYQEYRCGLGWAFLVKSCLGFGLGIDGLLNQILNYETEAVWALAIGGEFNYQRVYLTAQARNINTPQLETGDSIPFWSDISLQFQACEIIGLLFDFQTVIPFDPIYNAGVIIKPSRLGNIVLAAKTEPLSLIYGLKLFVGRIRLKYFGDLHYRLGPSHRIGCDFKL